jgi:hypothetical protein
MDWVSFGKSAAAVGGIMLSAGAGITYFSSGFLCSKWSNLEWPFISGLILSAISILVYAISRYFEFVRNPVIEYFKSYLPDIANVFGLWWIVFFLGIMPATVYIVMFAEKKVCNPDLNEMTEFKKKLIAELHSKELEKEKKA